MGLLVVPLLVTIGVVVAVCIGHYIEMSPARRRNEELIRRELLLYEEECAVERAKQIARTEGEAIRKMISRNASGQ